MSKTGRAVGIALTAGMFAFSTYMYMNSGDWVAAVFALGSLAYGLFFLQASGKSSS